MASSNKISDSIRNMYPSILSSENTDLEVITLLLQNMEVKMETGLREISQKLDHTLALQNKPMMGKNIKKSKSSITPGNTYFLNAYVDNHEQFQNDLDQEEVEKTLLEFEDILKDYEGEELKNRQAELIWSNLVTKHTNLVEKFEKLAAENPETVQTSAKKTTKKATKLVTDDKTEVKKTKKSKKASKEDDEVEEKPKKSKKAKKDAEPKEDDDEVEEKPKKSKKAKKDAEPKDDDDEVEEKPKKSKKSKKDAEPKEDDEVEDKEEDDEKPKKSKKSKKSKKEPEPEPEEEDEEDEEDE